MPSLKDWTTYVFAGIVVGAGLSVLWYEVNFDVFKTDEPADKQRNEPELTMGAWRLGHEPNMGAPLAQNMFVVYKVRGSDGPKVSRIVAMEGQKVEVKGEDVLVDGSPVPCPTKSTRSKFDVPEITVPRGCVFVVNDQRAKGAGADYDSRFLGPIPVDAI